MYRSVFLFGYAALVCLLPGTLAAPAPPKSDLNKRWHTINPSVGGPQFWPDHKLKYKFKDDDSKEKLKDIVKAGWKLWTDAGLDKNKIDLVETSDGDDNEVLTIQVTGDPKAVTRVGFSGGARMIFGASDDYGLLDKNANMAHELGHALGFYHEHQRPDRNNHVVFNCKNLQDYSEDKEKQGFCTDMHVAASEGWSSVEFIALAPSDQCSLSDAYDEDSIMHYPGGAGGKKAFLGLGHRDTVLGTKADPNTSFKKNMKPSSADIDRANAMYAGGNQKRAGGCFPEDDQKNAEEKAEDRDDD
ncbi:hypothetical protein XPA_008269 [Xanthoria parietina]